MSPSIRSIGELFPICDRGVSRDKRYVKRVIAVKDRPLTGDRNFSGGRASGQDSVGKGFASQKQLISRTARDPPRSLNLRARFVGLQIVLAGDAGNRSLASLRFLQRSLPTVRGGERGWRGGGRSKEDHE